MLATSLEEKLCAYERLPVKSKARDLAADEWRVCHVILIAFVLTYSHKLIASQAFFSDVSDKIRGIQTETNLPPLENQVKKWLQDGRVAPNVIDQPCQPPRPLTMDEKLEAACITKLDRVSE